MKITLGEGGPDESESFRFRIGQTVITKVSETVGRIESGVCFNGTKPDRIFYQIRLSNGKLWTMMEDTIAPSPHPGRL